MAFNLQQIEDLHTELRKHLGPVVCAALEDETVTDIKCSDGQVWVTYHRRGNVNTGAVLSEDDRRLALNVMASLLGKKINAESSSLSGELPLTGDRIQGFVPPTSQEPGFYIRIHAPEIFTFNDYLEKGILLPWQVKVIREHIQARSNIVFSGATGSGKTTLLNTALDEVSGSKEHVVVIEDTKEIKCNCPNSSFLLTNEDRSLQRLIVDSMRIKPERLIIGEVRDKAGLDLLRAWSTGHGGGMTTVHANSVAGVFQRYAQFCQEAGVPPQWLLMQSTIGLIVQMEKIGDQRRATEIEEVRHDVIAEQMPIALTRLGPS